MLLHSKQSFKDVTVTIPFSKDQCEVAIQTLIDDGEFGILESEFAYIRKRIMDSLNTGQWSGYTLDKIIGATYSIEDGVWECKCKISKIENG